MGEIVLSGLTGSQPLGALAAFGLLRCCDDTDPAGWHRLYWRKEPDWVAVLVPGRPWSADDLVGFLTARQRGRASCRELWWADDLKTDPGVCRAEALRAGIAAVAGRRVYADFLAAFGCELAVGSTGGVEPTAFHMTSGQQKFVRSVRVLAARLAGTNSPGRQMKGAEEFFREALFGPWRYEDPQHSLGWDPAAERLHALRGCSPRKDVPRGVAAAVWLAFEALPLFPCFLSQGKLTTRGFVRQEDGPAALSWPVWTEPASLAEVRSLVGLGALGAVAPPIEELWMRGVAAVFRSERYRVKTRGAYYVLRPASPAAWTAGNGSR